MEAVNHFLILMIKVMQQKLIAGVDVSKHTLDICIKPTGATLQVTNDLRGFKQCKKALGCATNILIVMEHTGYYSLKFEKFLTARNIGFRKISALEIKRSLGVIRGKNDKVDAVRIAEYSWLRRDQLIAQQMPAANLRQLRTLLSLRSKLVKDRSGYICRLKEIKNAGINLESEVLNKVHTEMIRVLTVNIKAVDVSITRLIKADSQLNQTHVLLRSIKGVGIIIAAYMIVVTENFTRFRNARKFNCYAGLAPFKHESGTSIRGKCRVSHLANKQIKTLLNMGACSAIQHNAEMREYYQKRVAEGKREMSCVNIIRSKMVSRMFAIVKRQSPYQEVLMAA